MYRLESSYGNDRISSAERWQGIWKFLLVQSPPVIILKKPRRAAAAAHPSEYHVSGRGQVSERGLLLSRCCPYPATRPHHRIEELSTVSQIGDAGEGGWVRKTRNGLQARLSPSKMGRKGKIGKKKRVRMRLILMSHRGHRRCGKFCSHCRMSN